MTLNVFEILSAGVRQEINTQKRQALWDICTNDYCMYSLFCEISQASFGNSQLAFARAA